MGKERIKGFSAPPVPERVQIAINAAGVASYFVAAFFPFQENGHPDGRLPAWETKIIEYVSPKIESKPDRSQLPPRFDSRH